MFYFTPLPGFFSPFPRGTGSLSVTQEYLALRDGSRGFTRDSTCPVLLGIQLRPIQLSTTGLSPSLVQYSAASSSFCNPVMLSHNPIRLARWFRLFPLRSPLLGESIFLSFPPATKMFQFAGLALSCLCIQQVVLRVAPFGYLRLNACFQLPGVFRRSPRPSSPLRA